MSTSTLITAEEFASMSFDMPCELVQGEIVEMTSPGTRHGKLCARLCFFLERWAREGGQFETLSNDSGMLTGRDPDTVRGPDLSVIARAKLPGGKLPQGHLTVAPDVTIEVKSPSDRWPDLLQKVAEYLAAGVSEVWVVDPEHFRLHAFQTNNEPTIYNREDRLTSAFLPDFQCPLNELFQGLD